MVATILSQVEFYFSDANLRRDKFLNQQIGQDSEGFVPIQVLLTFNRLKSLASSVEDVAKAISESKVLRLSEDQTKVSRVVPFSRDDSIDVRKRTVFLNHIDQDSTIESISEMMEKYGSVDMVRIPKLKKANTARKIIGVAFVEFASAESVTKVLEDFPPPKVKAQGSDPRPLYALDMDQYDKRNQEKMVQRNQEKAVQRNLRNSKQIKTSSVRVKGCLIHLTGISKETTKSQLIPVMKEIGDIKFVDLKPESVTAIIRCGSAEAAQAVLAHLSEKEVVLNGQRISGSIVGSEEEQQYWSDVSRKQNQGRPKRFRTQRGSQHTDDQVSSKRIKMKNEDASATMPSEECHPTIKIETKEADADAAMPIEKRRVKEEAGEQAAAENEGAPAECAA